MDVPVRELKARLSAYLRQAGAGEIITVTDRGRPVAVLGPPRRTVDLDAAVAAGWLTPATTTGLRPLRRQKGRGRILDVLTEDRNE